MYPYPPTTIILRKRAEHFQCLQVGRHFRVAVGGTAPKIAEIEAARNAGENVHVVDFEPRREVWSYPYPGHKSSLHIAVDKTSAVRRIYIV
jgi:hypothetical protein